MMATKVGPILIGLAYLALVVFIILFCADQSNGFDEYSKYWGLFATLLGIATGAIPSFFFKAQTDKANEQAAKESARAQAYASAADPDKVEAMKAATPELFMP